MNLTACTAPAVSIKHCVSFIMTSSTIVLSLQDGTFFYNSLTDFSTSSWWPVLSNYKHRHFLQACSLRLPSFKGSFYNPRVLSGNLDLRVVHGLLICCILVNIMQFLFVPTFFSYKACILFLFLLFVSEWHKIVYSPLHGSKSRTPFA